MDLAKKEILKRELGNLVKDIIEDNKKSSDDNSISSLRKLAANAEIEYSIIQKIAAGTKDPQFTTLIALADGLNMKLSELMILFESRIEAKKKRNK
jgi:transcriptional regulator with XRE-family HTH domain